LDLATIPFLDSDVYKSKFRTESLRQPVPVPKPIDAFTSNIGKEKSFGKENVSFAS
jgi:hypothetical protein